MMYSVVSPLEALDHDILAHYSITEINLTLVQNKALLIACKKKRLNDRAVN